VGSLHIHLVVVIVGCTSVTVFCLLSVSVFALLFSRCCNLPVDG
jgi:hypothetical protein